MRRYLRNTLTSVRDLVMNAREPYIITALMVVIVIVIVCLYFTKKEPVMEPPVPPAYKTNVPRVEIPRIEIPAPTDVDVDVDVDVTASVVRVTHYTRNSVMRGFGVAVQSDTETVVLTSRMLFLDDENGAVAVDGHPASFVYEDDELQLVALRVYTGLQPGVKLLVQELGYPAYQAPQSHVVTDTSTDVMLGDDINAVWQLLHNPPADCTGAPVFRAGHLIGLVVGLSQRSDEEAIMVDRVGLISFLDTVEEDLR